jgi:hypothetical protein
VALFVTVEGEVRMAILSKLLFDETMAFKIYFPIRPVAPMRRRFFDILTSFSTAVNWGKHERDSMPSNMIGEAGEGGERP